MLSTGHRQASRKRKHLNDQREETEKHRFYFFESEPVSPVGHVAAVVYRLLDLNLSSSCLTNQWIHFSSKRQHNTWFTSGSVRLYNWTLKLSKMFLSSLDQFFIILCDLGVVPVRIPYFLWACHVGLCIKALSNSGWTEMAVDRDLRFVFSGVLAYGSVDASG